MATFYCNKCKKLLDEKQFYYSNNLEKYPNGRLNICKKCITEKIDNYYPDTYLWILRECDVPYMPDQWMQILKYCEKEKINLTGITIIGRYLSKMKLASFRKFRWSHT